MAGIDTPDKEAAFAHCMRLARSHYENFPVASLAVPRSRRRYVAAIYAFARTADDFADEGDAPAAERLRKLEDWRRLLENAYAGTAEHPVFVALAETARVTGIPRQLLADLLTAFTMDVTVHRYASFADLLGYCRYSANPVGRLVLYLFGAYSEEAAGPSDALCTGLQLTNFWQDLSVDWARGRLYLPLDDVARFGYTLQDLQQGRKTPAFRALMAFQIERTAALLESGSSLLTMVSPRLRMELALTIRGGMAMLHKIEREEFSILHRRPVLSAVDKGRILLQTLAGKGV